MCHGFAIPTQYRLNVVFSRTLPALHFQEDDTLVVATPKDLAAALLEGKAVPLLDAEAATALDPIQDEEAAIALLTKTESLRPLTFEDDNEKFLNISRPYYALEPEHAIVDDSTGRVVGFVCSTRVVMPIRRESGGTPFAEAGRHMAAAGSVAALLRNPQKKR